MPEPLGTKRIKTERLLLRRIMPHDYFEVVKWYTKPEIASFMMNKTPLTKKQVFRMTFGRFRHYSNKDYYIWGIIYKGKMSGYIELLPVKNSEKKAFSLSYKVDMSKNNMGIASEAVKAVLEYMKNSDVDVILGTCDEANIGSKRVMEKAGMEMFGSLEANSLLEYGDGTKARRYRFKKNMH